MVSLLCGSGFEGQPVMLESGAIADSAVLPADAIQEQPILLDPQELLRSIHTTEDLHQPQLPEDYITHSAEAHSQDEAQWESTEEPQEAVHYHPVEISGNQQAASEALQGHSLILSFPTSPCLDPTHSRIRRPDRLMNLPRCCASLSL